MMPRTIFSVCYMLVFLCLSTRERADYRAHDCRNTNYSSDVYRTSLDSLFSSLISNASSSTNGFYNTTSALGTSDAIYGLFVCQGDLSPDACEQCVKSTSKKIVELCPDQKTAIIWYDECWLRYSNESIFSRRDDRVVWYLFNHMNITNEPDRFKKELDTMMNDITYQAATDRSGKRFATGQVRFSPFQELFTLAECTPDLSSDDCNICLRNAISYLPVCCEGKQGGRVLLPSCIIRYEVYRFFKIERFAPAPAPYLLPVFPPPPPSRPVQSKAGKERISVVFAIAIFVPASVFLVFVLLAIFLVTRRSRKRYNFIPDSTDRSEISRPESLQYKLSQIQAATNNFSIDHKIGEGGFGQVYKGTLVDGKEIAVKRLSRSSAQGSAEFKNEIILVAKLQHRNLVRLLGFCLEGEEQILIYEYIPNRSLDYFLFDSEKQYVLNWSRRYNIITGIARGLLYLHEDCRLRIVHRDLKASNVLLDTNMDPKIADFGTARIFGVDQSQENTQRIAGTFGYMAPEYVRNGQFSVKSDVYSFGVLLLEIISGKKNRRRYQYSNGAEDLLSYAWKNWRDGTPLALVDPTLGNTYKKNEARLCIHVGLLCVQENVEHRPNMAAVVLPLFSHSITLPAPQPPVDFCGPRMNRLAITGPDRDQSSSQSVPLSTNEVTITELYPR